MPITSQIRPKKTWLGVAAASALALSLAACSGGSSTAPAADEPAPAGNGKPEISELIVGITPVADQASVYIAVAEGFFEEEGLTVTPQPAQGGAALVPAMIAGDIQASFATYPSFLLAQAGGIDINIVAEGVRGNEESNGVWVKADSGIDSINDLEGKKVAVNTLKNTGELTIKVLMDEAGVDVSKVQFQELPFPDMVPTLQSGGVDAIWVVEPFQTAAEASGAKKLFANFSGPTDGVPLSGLGMTAEFVKANPNTVAAFIRAMEKANALLAENPDAAREIVPTYSSTTPELAAKLKLPKWVAGAASAKNLEVWNDIMVDQGAISAPVDMDKMVYVPGK
ncbi:ABC transporter substrate-binding protein [Salinibacterium sp. ZJ450]|uniref:ABC transporter substrate-binding protein n=1 Tax=Salinibacterium sp. ZJ450 TaxID=2708338 RepID=UPI00141F51E9|nr:ABC transporter substrate-binding protein [Salinibacterium sp. ZJ450]